MNDLLSKTYSGDRDVESGDGFSAVEMQPMDPDKNLAPFYEEMATINNDMESMRKLLVKLQNANEESKTIHNAQAMKALRDRMEKDIAEVSKTARSVKDKLVELDKANAASRKIKGCEEGTVTDRLRQTFTNRLRQKLKDDMEDFGNLRTKIVGEYRETIERRYYTVTGQKPDEETLEHIIETGESETFLQKAIQEQGRGQIIETIKEIQERHDGVKEIEKNLLALQQIFLDMAVLVEAQGDQLNVIQTQVENAKSYVERAATQLGIAKKHQRNSRKWQCIGIIALLILILVIVLPLVLKK